MVPILNGKEVTAKQLATKGPLSHKTTYQDYRAGAGLGQPLAVSSALRNSRESSGISIVVRATSARRGVMMRTAVERVSTTSCIRMLNRIGPNARDKKDIELTEHCRAFIAAPSQERALAVLGNICSDAQYLDCLEPPFEQWSSPPQMLQATG